MEIDALVLSQHALLRRWNKEAGGYPLVNVTCLSATLPLVNCSDYYCDNVAIKKEALHQNGGGWGLWSERWMCTDYTTLGNALRRQSIQTPPHSLSKAAGYYCPSSLISVPNQYSSAAVRNLVNQSAASGRRAGGEGRERGASESRDVQQENQKTAPNETP